MNNTIIYINIGNIQNYHFGHSGNNVFYNTENSPQKLPSTKPTLERRSSRSKMVEDRLRQLKIEKMEKERRTKENWKRLDRIEAERRRRIEAERRR